MSDIICHSINSSWSLGISLRSVDNTVIKNTARSSTVRSSIFIYTSLQQLKQCIWTTDIPRHRGPQVTRHVSMQEINNTCRFCIIKMDYDGFTVCHLNVHRNFKQNLVANVARNRNTVFCKCFAAPSVENLCADFGRVLAKLWLNTDGFLLVSILYRTPVWRIQIDDYRALHQILNNKVLVSCSSSQNKNNSIIMIM